MVWAKTEAHRPRTKKATNKPYEYITMEGARRQNRCLCQGCGFCRGEQGYPCGQGGLGAGVTKCSWCGRSRTAG